jgi:uncharacterized protein YfaA (DUF2138 family)
MQKFNCEARDEVRQHVVLGYQVMVTLMAGIRFSSGTLKMPFDVVKMNASKTIAAAFKVNILFSLFSSTIFCVIKGKH